MAGCRFVYVRGKRHSIKMGAFNRERNLLLCKVSVSSSGCVCVGASLLCDLASLCISVAPASLHATFVHANFSSHHCVFPRVVNC